jgi:hypothetical protein
VRTGRPRSQRHVAAGDRPRSQKLLDLSERKKRKC